jgi:Ni/Co efflux regulator RcnB
VWWLRKGNLAILPRRTKMKTTLIASALITLSLATSSAFAQRDRHENDRDNYRNDDARRFHHDDVHGADARRYHRDDVRGDGARHGWRRGERLSAEYRDNRYVVNDWRARHLAPPPRGHHWVRAGNDYVLAAIATGVIVQVLLNN